MNHWFNAEFLIRQQQMKLEKESRESWKFRQRPRKALKGSHSPKETEVQAGNKRCVVSN